MPSFTYPSKEIILGDIVANPGESASATIWDSTAITQNGTLIDTCSTGRRRLVKRITFDAFIDVNDAVFVIERRFPNSTTWRIVNGPASLGEAITANTYFERSVARVGGDQRIRIVTATGPTVWNVAYLLHPDAGLSQE